ncbi:hypothetical protein KGM_202299 [Danaus plexippus plexippus]|uniref:Uncharacterized protein n=1 Tax=Danaus plexippus plexippus TaxID=278856 RepID=A0A212ENI1_DANPL|nr:hypothetical protein KGM_202299 [Danaus plexippus plexippus]
MLVLTQSRSQYLLRHLSSLSLPLRRQPVAERDGTSPSRRCDKDGAFIHNRVRHPVSALMDHFISF